MEHSQQIVVELVGGPFDGQRMTIPTFNHIVRLAIPKPLSAIPDHTQRLDYSDYSELVYRFSNRSYLMDSSGVTTGPLIYRLDPST